MPSVIMHTKYYNEENGTEPYCSIVFINRFSTLFSIYYKLDTNFHASITFDFSTLYYCEKFIRHLHLNYLRLAPGS